MIQCAHRCVDYAFAPHIYDREFSGGISLAITILMRMNGWCRGTLSFEKERKKEYLQVPDICMTIYGVTNICMNNCGASNVCMNIVGASNICRNMYGVPYMDEYLHSI